MYMLSVLITWYLINDLCLLFYSFILMSNSVCVVHSKFIKCVDLWNQHKNKKEWITTKITSSWQVEIAVIFLTNFSISHPYQQSIISTVLSVQEYCDKSCGIKLLIQIFLLRIISLVSFRFLYSLFICL